MTESVVTYKVRMERMSNDKWPINVCMSNSRKILWEKECKRKVNGRGLQCVRPRLIGGVFGERWMILNGAGEGREWTAKEWKILIDRCVKVIGLANGNGQVSDSKLINKKKAKE